MILRFYIYMWCLLLPLMLLGQQSHPKTIYDSIVNLELEISETKMNDLVEEFFEKHKDTDNPLELAECYHEEAKRIKVLGDLKKAIAHAEKAVAIREEYKDTVKLNKSLYNLGYFNEEAGNYFKAIAIYQRILKSGATDLFSKTYNQLGVCYTHIGDFHKALSNLEKAKNYSKSDTNKIFKSHLYRLHTYSFMEMIEFKKEILSYIREADSLKTLLYNAGHSIENQDLLSLSKSKGNFFDKIGDHKEALKHHKNALEISREMGDSFEIAGAYNNLGITTAKLGRDDEAYEYYKQALDHAPTEDRKNRIAIYDNLGDYWLKKREFTKALEHYQKAIYYGIGETENPSFREVPPEEKLEISPYKLDLLTCLTDKANAWLQYYYYKKDKAYLKYALQTLKRADHLIDIIRFESAEFRSKLFWREKGAEIYMNAVAVCYQLHLPEDAFYFMEKNKALLLLENLTHEKAKENARLPEDLAEREFRLKQEIHREEQAILDAAAASQTEKDSIKDIIFDHKEAYEKFIDYLESRYPDYYNYKRRLAVISYDDALAEQQENTVMLHYILNEEEGYGLLISEEHPRFFKIDSVEALHHNIDMFRSKLIAPFDTKKEEESYRSLAFQLYKSLFRNIDEEFLADKRLCIIPDHKLQKIPFDALMTSPDIENAYLLNLCELYYAYSASFLALNQSLTRNPPEEFIVFAPVEFSNLEPLPGSEQEINRIVEIFPGEVFLKEQATKEEFISNANVYRIIHLATHASAEDNTSPWIAFRDEVLSLEELYAVKNQAQLVVLSACKTSEGELKTGEGMMSLARGFFSSGTQTVVATLWNVNDQSHKEIMIELYKQLEKGHTKAGALRYAKQQYLSNQGGFVPPYYWSSLVLIGDAGPIAPPATNTTIYLIAVGIGLIILFIGLWIRKRYIHK